MNLNGKVTSPSNKHPQSLSMVNILPSKKVASILINQKQILPTIKRSQTTSIEMAH